jgi:hypothetical protein
MAKHINQSGRAQGGTRISPPERTPIDYNSNKPVFSFIYLSSKYCVSKCTAEQKVAFVDKMRTLSGLTWKQILVTERGGNGFELLNRAIKDDLPPSVKPDVKLIGTTFHNHRRIVGFREDATFHIIWFDYDGSLYDHGG